MTDEDKNEQKNKAADEQNANWTKEQYIDHLRKRGENHYHYKIYSNDTQIIGIDKERTIYLSDGSGWNDKIDRNNFCRKEQPKRFAKCFSFSKSENVAMWMLYSGMGGNGLMIDFNQTIMKAIVKNCDEVEIGYWKGPKEHREFVVKTKIPKEDFELYLIDILYYGDSDEKGKYDLKRSGTKYELGEAEIIDRLSGCVKSYPWSYENEVRLILELKKENEEVNKIYDDKLIPSARISFENILATLPKKKTFPYYKVFESPNYKGEHRYYESALFDKMYWNLCADCPRKLNLVGKLKSKKCQSPVCPYYSKKIEK